MKAAFTLLVVMSVAPVARSAPLVGMITREYADEQRQNWERTAPRPLRTLIWYPIDSATERDTIFANDPMFVPVEVAPGAEISRAANTYPLVVLSHGTGGSAVMMMWLGNYLASHGYIVAAVNHHGNNSSEKTPQGFLLFWERARDLKVLIDRMLADPLFGPRIDRARIGAAGFSLGGYTVIAAAGGRFSQQTWEAFCKSPQRDFTCEPQSEFPEALARFAELRRTDRVVQESLRHAGDSFRDSRIRAVFAIAPALGGGFTKAGLKEIKIPVCIVVGSADTIAPSATNAQRFMQMIPNSVMTVPPGNIGHYTFLHECTEHGRNTLPVCRDAAGLDRAAVHNEVAEEALQFFNASLNGK